MNRYFVFAVLLLLGRASLPANEPAPAPHSAEPATAGAASHETEEKPAPHEASAAKEMAAEHPAAGTETEQQLAEPIKEPEPEKESLLPPKEEDSPKQEEPKEKPDNHGKTEEAPPAHESASEHAPEQTPKEAHATAAHDEKEAPAPHAEEHGTKEEDPHAQPAKAEAKEHKTEEHAEKAPEAHGKEAAHGTEATHEKADAHGKEATHAAHGEESEVLSLSSAELLNYAQKAYDKGRYDMALIAYRQLLSHKMPKAKQKVVLIGYSRTLRKKGELTKAVAVYERLIKDFQLDAEAPEIYLELGRAQRALGAYKTAITRFYNVINSTIKLPEDGAARYRQLAKTAQFEIAETYFMSGNYTEASRFYSRLRLLDLAPIDRAKAHFKAAYSLQLAEDHKGAVAMFRSFLDQNPDDENVPEAHYQLAVSLNALGRPQEALLETLDLLRTEKAKTTKDPKVWAYWQRKTGNQIANEFYNRGNFRSALAIYETLVELAQDPAWKLPITYQIALCNERLGITDHAIQSYQSIIKDAATTKADDMRRDELMDISRMAEWRLKQINWTHATERKFDSLIPQGEEPLSPPPAPATK